MKVKDCFKLILVSFAMALGIVGCSSEIDEPMMGEDTSMECLYNELSCIPTIMIDKSSNTQSLSNCGQYGLYILSEDVITYLKSLSQDEFVSQMNSYVESFGFTYAEIEDFRSENYLRIFDKLGGNEGFEKLMNFSSQYIDTEGGWNVVRELLPNGLTEEQSKVFVGLAVYIDKVSRPMYNNIFEYKSSRANVLCEREAAMRLAALGVGFGVDTLLELMGGVTITLAPIEDTATLAELFDIWLQYEICEGRWH